MWGMFILLILCGLGLPMPEDIILVTAGYLAADDGRSWLHTTVLMYAGVMGGDSIIFLIGRHYGMRVLGSKWAHRFFPPAKQAKVQNLFDRYHSWVLFLGRFLPGLRAPIFCTAGAMKVPYMKFLMLDGIAAIVSVPVFVWLGHWLWGRFHDDVDKLREALSRTHSYSLWVALGVCLAVIVLAWLWPRNRQRDSKSSGNP